MTVTFSKQHSNYNPQNLVDMLSNIPNDFIKGIVNHPTDYVKVIGDIHRSQMTSDNPKNNYWFKIKIYVDGENVPEFNSVHIYVCFRTYVYLPKKRIYKPGKCTNPRETMGTDIADISGIVGYWEYVKITYSHMAPVCNIKQQRTKSVSRKKSVACAAKLEMIRKFKESMNK